MTKACGMCTLCCELIPVRELKKLGWHDCTHRRGVLHAAGPGCGIYATRPPSCRGWSCQWLITDDWPDEWRPDRVGFVVDENLDLIKINGVETPAAQIWAAKGCDDAWSSAAGELVIALLIESGVAVLWRMAPGDRARAFRKLNGRIVRSQILPTPPRTDTLPPLDLLRTARAEQILRRGRSR